MERTIDLDEFQRLITAAKKEELGVVSQEMLRYIEIARDAKRLLEKASETIREKLLAGDQVESGQLNAYLEEHAITGVTRAMIRDELGKTALRQIEKAYGGRTTFHLKLTERIKSLPKPSTGASSGKSRTPFNSFRRKY